jgi:hypothetical protein
MVGRVAADSGLNWVARYFKGYFVGGSIRVIKDILLRKRWRG